MEPGALFITYDGLLDPLGASQILPYVRALARGRQMHILSFEKPARLQADAGRLAGSLSTEGIGWTSLPFSSGAVGKAVDLLRMHALALRLVRSGRLGIVHCRGHVPALVGYVVKKLTGARLLFDYRGMWVDERVDKGGWNLARPRDRLLHGAFKKVERRLLRQSDQVVVLTHAAVPAVSAMGVPDSCITVIPCCADFAHFRPRQPEEKRATRERLFLPTEGLVLGYLGSVGRMYMTEQFLDFCELALRAGKAVGVLCITPDPEAFHGMLGARGWSRDLPAIRVVTATRDQVPELLGAVDVQISFFLPTPARLGTSPTKVAECFAQGIAVVTNPGIGDMTELIGQLHAGAIVDPLDEDSMRSGITALREMAASAGARLRAAARPLLGLEHAARQYQSVYSRMGAAQC